jgi:hypothetical protein
MSYQEILGHDVETLTDKLAKIPGVLKPVSTSGGVVVADEEDEEDEDE